MALISQQIMNLLDGVSQQPDKLRAQSQFQAQTNVYDSIVHGKMKRPPTTHVAKLSSTPWTPGRNGGQGAYIWAVNRDTSERYHVVVNSETPTIQVFDATTGQQYPVLTPQGSSYLTIQPPPTFTETLSDDTPFPGSYALGTAIESIGTSLGHSWSQAASLNPGGFPNGASSGLKIAQSGATFGLDGAQTSSSLIENHGAVIPAPPVANVTASMTVTITVGGHAIGQGILLRGFTNGAQQCGYFVGIGFGTYNGGTTGAKLSRFNADGTVTTIGSATLASGDFNSAQTFTLTVQVVGQTFTLQNNGVTFGTFTDAGGFGTAGTVGLYAFDNSGGTVTFLVTDFKATYTAPVTLPTPIQFGHKFMTVQDSTFIANQSVQVLPLKTAATTTPVRNPEALIAVRQADYGTNYTVVINGITLGLSTTLPTAPNARQQLTTDLIATQINGLITASSVLTGFTTQVFGSTIYITRTDGHDFTIMATDGLADNGIEAIKGSVQLQTDLPARALNGFVILVQPDPNNKLDATYYVYDDLGKPLQNGIWREAAAPGILTQLDPATMPHVLTKLGNAVAGFPADGGPVTPPQISGFNLVNHFICWTSCSPACAACTSGLQLGIGDHGHQIVYTIPASATGSAQQVVTANFDVTNANLPQAEYITVQVTDSRGGKASAIFGGGVTAPNQSITYNAPLHSGDTVTITLLYSRGATPPASHQGGILVHAQTDPSGFNNLTFAVPTSTGLQFASQIIYPQGVTYSVTVGSENHTFTPSSDQTATQLATAIFGLAWTTTTPANPSPGLVTFSSAGVAPTVTYSNDWNQSQQYHNGGLNLAPGSLIGFAISDETDGSTSIVTANTSTTITASTGLSGGVQNKFLNGHLVSIQGPAGQLYFIFQPVNWSGRGVGDDNTNPFPTFTFDFIEEIFFTSGRIGVASGENVVMTGANDVFNFFRTTVVTLLDSDRIDAQANSDTVSDWHSVVHWAEGVWIWAANIQAEIPTNPAVANSTFSILPTTRYPSSPKLRPLGMDRRIYFARERTGQFPVTQIFRYQRIRFPFQGFIAEESTKPIPTYLQGSPVQLVGDPALEIMVAMTTAVPNQLYPYIFHYDEDQRLQQESWSTWQLDPGATILAMDMLDGKLGMIVSRSDGVYLEYIDLQVALYEQL